MNNVVIPKDHIKRTTVVTVGSGTTAQVSTDRITNGADDQKYNSVVGVLVQVRSNGGDPNFRIGIRRDNLDVDDAHHNGNWTGGSNAAPKERVYPIFFKIYGSQVFIVTENVATLSSDLVFEMTLILANDKDLEENYKVNWTC